MSACYHCGLNECQCGEARLHDIVAAAELRGAEQERARLMDVPADDLWRVAANEWTTQRDELAQRVAALEAELATAKAEERARLIEAFKSDAGDLRIESILAVHCGAGPGGHCTCPESSIIATSLADWLESLPGVTKEGSAE